MLSTTSGKEHKDTAADVTDSCTSNLRRASLYDVVDSEIVVIGGALLDIVYQPQSATTCATSMYGTSTPCRLARMASGGVGRNIAEATARLGTRVVFRTILGGGEQAEPKRGIQKNNKNKRGTMNMSFDGCCPEGQTTANSSVEPLKKSLSLRVETQQQEQPPDTNGRLLLEEMRRLELETDFLFNVSTEVVANASSATYMALLDGKGELAAAAGVVDLFEKHFSAQIALDVFENPFSDLCEKSSDWKISGTSDDDTKDATVINKMALRQNGGEPSTNERRKVKVNPFSVKWVVIDGNVAQETLEGVCVGIQILNNEMIKSKKKTQQKVSCGSCATEGRETQQQQQQLAQKDERIRVAYDPISKTQGLRCLNVLKFIDIMKPNIFECIAIAFAFCEKQIHSKRSHQNERTKRGGGGVGGKKEKEAEEHRLVRSRYGPQNGLVCDEKTQGMTKESSSCGGDDDDSPDTLSAARLSIQIHALVRNWEEKRSKAVKERRSCVDKEEFEEAGACEERELEELNQQQYAVLQHFGNLEFASLKSMTLVHDRTFREIVAITIGAAVASSSERKEVVFGECQDYSEKESSQNNENSSLEGGGGEKDKEKTTGERVFSPAATLFWELFEHLAPTDQEIIGLLSAMFLVVEGGVGQILCSLGESGCWVVGSDLEKKNGAADNDEENENNNLQTAQELPLVELSSGEHCGGDVSVRKVPSIPIPQGHALVKVTGAGDSFLSGYLCGLLALEMSKDGKGEEAEKKGEEETKLCTEKEKERGIQKQGCGHNIGSLLRLSEKAHEEGWLLPERAAALAALSSLLSDETINPCILEFVTDDEHEEHAV